MLSTTSPSISPCGRITALVGESGSGKSTIARCLARLEQPSAGQVLLDGEDILRTERRRVSRAYRRKVQMVFQDPFGSLNPVHRIEHFLTRALVLHGHSAAPEALRELMKTVGLTEDMLQSYPHELSGGQRQRVSIARALAVEPRLILADEPTSMLDVSVRVGVLNLMRRLRDERNIAMLYITHDLGSARYLADTTMVMFAGELVEGGDALAVMDAPAHPYTRLLLSAVPDPERAAWLRPRRARRAPRGDPQPHVLPLRRRRHVQPHRTGPPHRRRRRRPAPLGALPAARTRLRHRPPRPQGHGPAGRRGPGHPRRH